MFSLMCCLSESLSNVYLTFRVKNCSISNPKSQRRTMRRRNFENSRGELSSRRLVSSQRYLSPERTVEHGTPSSSPIVSYDVISFPRFPRLRLIVRCDKGRGREEEDEATHCESREPRNCLFGGKSEAGQADAQKAIIRALSSLIRSRGRLYPRD